MIDNFKSESKQVNIPTKLTIILDRIWDSNKSLNKTYKFSIYKSCSSNMFTKSFNIEFSLDFEEGQYSLFIFFKRIKVSQEEAFDLNKLWIRIFQNQEEYEMINWEFFPQLAKDWRSMLLKDRPDKSAPLEVSIDDSIENKINKLLQD